jgi:hypothetical protein
VRHAFALRPAASTRDSVAPDFGDAEHVKPAFEVCEGIMAAVFEQLRSGVAQGRADPDQALLVKRDPNGAA